MGRDLIWPNMDPISARYVSRCALCIHTTYHQYTSNHPSGSIRCWYGVTHSVYIRAQKGSWIGSQVGSDPLDPGIWGPPPDPPETLVSAAYARARSIYITPRPHATTGRSVRTGYGPNMGWYQGPPQHGIAQVVCTPYTPYTSNHPSGGISGVYVVLHSVCIGGRYRVPIGSQEGPDPLDPRSQDPRSGVRSRGWGRRNACVCGLRARA